MAIPSGSGSEILTSTSIHAQSNTATSFRWDGTPATTGTSSYTVPANHIITVISIYINEVNDTDELFTLYINDGSNDLYLLREQSLTSKSTFVVNDRFVLKAGHYLKFNLVSAGDVDAYCTYIDQDWT